MAPLGRLRLLLSFTVAEGLITEIDVIADADQLRAVELGAPAE